MRKKIKKIVLILNPLLKLIFIKTRISKKTFNFKQFFNFKTENI